MNFYYSHFTDERTEVVRRLSALAKTEQQISSRFKTGNSRWYGG